MSYRIYPLYLYLTVVVIFFILTVVYTWQSMSAVSYIILILLSVLFGYLLYLCLIKLNRKYDFFIVMLPIIGMLLMYLLYFYLFTTFFDS